jgi:mannose-1-phosphate guanylyltransferase
MRALLLSAGLGTRLRPVTDHTSKCLVPINGRPLLSYWLDLLVGAGIKKILINTHYLPESVNDYIGRSGYSEFITTVFEEKLLGTGGTLLKNRRFFEGGPIMLIHADNLSKFDVSGFMRAYVRRPAGMEITMMTFTTDSPESCGIVELDQLGVVRAFHEKVGNPPGRLANAAVYIVSPAVIDFIASLGKEVVDFSTEVLPHYLGRINTFHNPVYHRDIGTVESLRRAEKEYPLVESRLKNPPPS